MSKIRVPNNFGGVQTNERRVLPGDYDSLDHPGLHGAGRYMVENGFAFLIEDESEAVEKPTQGDEIPISTVDRGQSLTTTESAQISPNSDEAWEIITDETNGTIKRNTRTGEERSLVRPSGKRTGKKRG